MKIKPLTISDVEFIAHRLALETMNHDHEPIPPFHTRSPGKLESCLEEPFQTYDGKYLHHRFEARAAVLFYLIIKNHCFTNGNKRMAVTITVVFCLINNRWLNVSPMTLYKIAKDVAESAPKDRELMIRVLKQFFRKYLTARESIVT